MHKGYLLEVIHNITYWLCRERGEPVPADQSLDIARRIKERHCYIAADMAKVCCFIHPFFCFLCCIPLDSDLQRTVTSDDTT